MGNVLVAEALTKPHLRGRGKRTLKIKGIGSSATMTREQMEINRLRKVPISHTARHLDHTRTNRELPQSRFGPPRRRRVKINPKKYKFKAPQNPRFPGDVAIQALQSSLPFQGGMSQHSARKAYKVGNIGPFAGPPSQPARRYNAEGRRRQMRKGRGN